MTEEQRIAFNQLANELDEQIGALSHGGYELTQAIIRLTEAAMWIRRALDRG